MEQVRVKRVVASLRTNRVFGILLWEVVQISMLRYAEQRGIAEFKYLPEPIATRLIVSVAMTITDLCVRVMLPVFLG
jgi:hypothetical protein